MATSAVTLKEQGNKAFQEADFKEAEILYTRAYVKQSLLDLENYEHLVKTCY